MNNLSLFLTCVAIWSTTWLAITYQLGAVAPEASVGYRFLLAAAIVAAWCRLRGLKLSFNAGEHVALALMGLAMYSVSYIFVYHAERFVVSGLVAIGYSAGPLLSMFGMRLFFGQPITARMAAGACMGLAGIVLVFWPEFGRLAANRDTGLGALFTFLAVLLSMTGGLIAHRNHSRKLSGLPTMAWSMGYGGLSALLIALALGHPLGFLWTPGYVLSLLYLAVLGSVVTFAAWLKLMERVGPARASYVGVMVPIVALLISTVFEGLAWHALTAVGIAVSVGGNVLVLRQTASRK